MNKELELEAEKYANQINKNWFGMKLSEKNNDTKKDFIAGATTSKYVEKQKLEFAIEQLKETDFNMCKLLRQDAINFDLSQEEAVYKWQRTKWHLEIVSKIKELEQKLSEL